MSLIPHSIFISVVIAVIPRIILLAFEIFKLPLNLLAYLFNVTLDSLLENEINIIEPSLDELRNEVADLRYSLNEKGLRKVADYMYDLIEIKKYKIGN